MPLRRMLFVTRIFPEDFSTAVSGVYHRMRMFLDASQQVSDDLHILFYANPAIAALPGVEAETRRKLVEHWGIRATVTMCPLNTKPEPKSIWQDYIEPAFGMERQLPYSETAGGPQLAAFERCLDLRPDAVFIHRLMAISPALRTRRALPGVFFDLDDIEHVRFLRELRQPPYWPGKYLRYLQLPSLYFGERHAIRFAQKTFVCSDHDREYLSRRFGSGGIVTIPNGVVVPASIGQSYTSQTLMFLGSYTYAPNVVAAEYLCKAIWPLIHAEVPGARLLIAGNQVEQLPSFSLRLPHVEFAGFVSDLDDYYRNAQVVCCPILSGGGTRIKLIEAAAHGKPIVSTTIGAEGLTLCNGKEIILADGAAAFAQACIALLRDSDRCRELGAAARSAVRINYARENIVPRIREELTLN